MEDFPLLLLVSAVMMLAIQNSPSLTHQQQSRLASCGGTWSRRGSLCSINFGDIGSVLFMDTFKSKLDWTDIADRTLTWGTIVATIELGPPTTGLEKRHDDGSKSKEGKRRG
jgi:hypothetical protein